MMRGIIGWFGMAALVGAGCGVNYPDNYPPADYTRRQLLGAQEPEEPVEVPHDVQRHITKILYDIFGKPSDPKLMPPYLSSNSELDRIYAGSRLYQTHCIHCHGMSGGGDGPTAAFLFPRPRDYRRGTFKWKSTERNAKPTREDLVRIVRDGAIGTSMPPFRLMPQQDIEELVDYVIYLSKRGELERRLLQFYLDQGFSAEELKNPETLEEIKKELDGTASEAMQEINESWASAGDAVLEPESPLANLSEDSPEYLASLERGKTLFLGDKAACYKCHNKDGQADPEKMAEEEKKKMFDDWGFTNYPRNLRLGMYRGGRRPVDVFRRIHQGIAGASMPEGGKSLKPEEIWDLVNFIRAIPYQPDLLPLDKPKKDAHAHGHDAEDHASKPAGGHGG